MPSSVLDFAKPYEIMIGMWAGMNCTYTPKGVHQSSGPSRVSIYWKDHRTIHYRQLARPDWIDPTARLIEEEFRQHATGLMFVSFDLEISNKRGIGGGTVRNPNGTEVKVTATGTETMPGVYLFELAYETGATFYNNQYFMNSNQRNIVGPLVVGKDTRTVIAQSFSRISYDVPKEYQWDLSNIPAKYAWKLPRVSPQHALA